MEADGHGLDGCKRPIEDISGAPLSREFSEQGSEEEADKEFEGLQSFLASLDGINASPSLDGINASPKRSRLSDDAELSEMKHPRISFGAAMKQALLDTRWQRDNNGDWFCL